METRKITVPMNLEAENLSDSERLSYIFHNRAVSPGIADQVLRFCRGPDDAAEALFSHLSSDSDRLSLLLHVVIYLFNCGQLEKTKLLINQARDWGANELKVAEILLGELGHSISNVAGSRSSPDERNAGRENEKKTTEAQLDSLSLKLGEISSEVKGLMARLGDVGTDVSHGFESIAKLLAAEATNSTRQIESMLRIHRYLSTGQREPGFHGWPVSPDYCDFAIELLDKNYYDYVFEFGSGTSTVIVGKAIKMLKNKRKEREIKYIAFEHEKEFYEKTLEELNCEELLSHVELKLAPLVNYMSDDGDVYPYYDIANILSEMRVGIDNVSRRALLLVDGPPGSLRRCARYPAVPIVIESMGKINIDILLDDYLRDDEKRVAEMWCVYLRNSGYTFEMSKKEMEKGGCLIRAVAP